MNPLARFTAGQFARVIAAERQSILEELTAALGRVPTSSELLDGALARAVALREVGSAGFVRRLPAEASHMRLDDGPVLGATEREGGR